jgi:hypothetical protein
VPNILFWSEDPSALVASHFSALLFSTLALERHVSLLEAYALALYATQVRPRARGVCVCLCVCLCVCWVREEVVWRAVWRGGGS